MVRGKNAKKEPPYVNLFIIPIEEGGKEGGKGEKKKAKITKGGTRLPTLGMGERRKFFYDFPLSSG